MRETHVVVLPYLALGHLMPFYHLSLALAKHGIHVHYSSTPKNSIRLPTPPQTVSNLVHFVSIPMPVLKMCPLPAGAEATADIPNESGPDIMATFDLLQQPFEEFVLSLSPDWLTVDCIPHWAVDIGGELDVPVVFFLCFSAAAKLFFGPPEFLVGEGRKRLRSTAEDLMVPPPWVGFSSSVAYRKFEAIGALIAFYGGDCPPAYRICKLLEGCEAVAIRSCNEFEGESI